MSIKVSITGYKKDFKSLIFDDVKKATRLISELAEDTKDYIKNGIKNDSLDLARLSDMTLFRRAQRGNLDETPLADTDEYVDSIEVFKSQNKNGQERFTVTVPDKKHKPSGLPLAELGAVHEYGRASGKWPIPARPHWAPALDYAKQQLIKRLIAFSTTKGNK